MSLALSHGRPAYRRHLRRERWLLRAGGIVLSVVLLIWTLLPAYNMMLIALDEEGNEFTGSILPPDPNFDSFRSIWTEDYYIVDHFWHQFANSIYMAVATMVLTVMIGSLASFALSRMRLRRGWIVSDAAMLTYVLPAPYLEIPIYRIMRSYGLADS
jgi:multiple sugar transport system permease protein